MARQRGKEKESKGDEKADIDVTSETVAAHVTKVIRSLTGVTNDAKTLSAVNDALRCEIDEMKATTICNPEEIRKENDKLKADLMAFQELKENVESLCTKNKQFDRIVCCTFPKPCFDTCEPLKDLQCVVNKMKCRDEYCKLSKEDK